MTTPPMKKANSYKLKKSCPLGKQITNNAGAASKSGSKRTIGMVCNPKFLGYRACTSLSGTGLEAIPSVIEEDESFNFNGNTKDLLR